MVGFLKIMAYLPQPSKSKQFENREYLKVTSYDLVALEIALGSD